MGPKVGPGSKNVKFGQISQAKMPMLTISKRLEFCTFYPNPNSTVLTNFQLWHRSSSLISGNQDIFLKSLFSYCFCIFDELYLYNPKSREDRIDCCNNLGSYVLVKISFKWMWPTLVDLGVFKVGPRPKNTTLASVLSTILAVLKKLKI